MPVASIAILLAAVLTACGSASRSSSTGLAPSSVDQRASAVYGYKLGGCKPDELSNELDNELGASSARAYDCNAEGASGYGVILLPGGGGTPYNASSESPTSASELTGPVIAAKIQSELRTKANQRLKSVSCGQATDIVAGDTVQCKVALPSGERVTLPATVRGGSGRFTVDLGSPTPSDSESSTQTQTTSSATPSTSTQASGDVGASASSTACKDSNAPSVTVTAKGTSCAKADALLVALPDEPMGRQSIQGWSCETPSSGGQTTCTLRAGSVTFLPDAAGQTGTGDSGGTAATESTDCGTITAPGGTTFVVDFHLGSCAQALAIARAYVQASSATLSAGQLPANATVLGWKCSISLNDSKLVQFFCIGSASGQQVDGIVKQSTPANTSSGSLIVATLDQAFAAHPPEVCSNGTLCAGDSSCNVANATTVISQINANVGCADLANKLTATGAGGSWTVQGASNQTDTSGCNLMGTGRLDRNDEVDVDEISGEDAADICQALDASGDWEGQAG